MRNRVYVTVERPSVCLSHRSTAAALAGGFAAERSAGRRCRSAATATGAAYQLQVRSVAMASQQAPALSSKCEQCHVDSRLTRLNTDLFNTPRLSYYLPAKHAFRLRISKTVVLPVDDVTLNRIRTSASALTNPLHGKPTEKPEIPYTNFQVTLLYVRVTHSICCHFDVSLIYRRRTRASRLSCCTQRWTLSMINWRRLSAERGLPTIATVDVPQRNI